MFSTKGRYALRIMVCLAGRRGRVVSVSEIAGELGISAKYAEQIMTILKRAGYVTAMRGSCGGYALAGSAEEYRAGDILRLMESSAFPGPCMSGECGSKEGCALKSMWNELFAAGKAVLDKYTIAKLAYGD